MSGYENYTWVFDSRPKAYAEVRGDEKHPDLRAEVYFYPFNDAVVVSAYAQGLPIQENGRGVFGFHIHSGQSCSGNSQDPFADALTHYNPENLPHPYHAGDMPPLFGENGKAFSAFMTKRFIIDEIIGKTVIIHSMPDDFTTQPSGDSGSKIACGVIIQM